MRQFVISTDNTADLPISYLVKRNIGVINLSYVIDEDRYGGEKELDPKDFYHRVRLGAMPTSSQVNPEEAKEFLEQYLLKGYDVLHIAFSSGLSGTYNSMRIAADELLQEHSEARIIVVDSLAASMGEGLLVEYAYRMKQDGASMEEIAKWLESHKNNLVHMFTVDDLKHLYRGGRVSRATAIIGSVVNIKPILHVDTEGHLIPIDKVRGRKKSLQTLVKYMDQKMGSYRTKNPVIFISHGDCLEDAVYVQHLITEKYGEKTFLINYVGPTIGTHSGPGTIALFFMGDEK